MDNKANDLEVRLKNAREQYEETMRQVKATKQICESAKRSYQFLMVIGAIMCGLTLVLIGCFIYYFASSL